MRLRPDFYSQVTQFVLELSLAMTDLESFADTRYSKRLRSWWSSWSAANAGDEGQVRIQERLAALVTEVLEYLDGVGSLSQGRAKAELWVREDPDTRMFTLWGSSEARLQQPSHRASITLGSDYFPVQAFAKRATAFGEVPSARSHNWRYHISVPVILAGEPWHELPVGVVTLLFGPGCVDFDSTTDADGDTVAQRTEAAGLELLSEVAVAE